jgi:hypothetical protein
VRRAPSHREIKELLGAFALDAIVEDERAAVAGHVSACARCSREADAYLEAAALIADEVADPPGALWRRIAASLEPRPLSQALRPDTGIDRLP